ncbi:MAG: hypothetical protein ACR2MX_09600 [Cyclobacteriaceae bacterium]
MPLTSFNRRHRKCGGCNYYFVFVLELQPNQRKLKYTRYSFVIVGLLFSHITKATPQEDYLNYHLKIRTAEELIAVNSYESALKVYEEVFDSYPFVFRRDYKVAAQVAWKLKHTSKACEFIKHGIASGWKMKEIKKTSFLKSLRRTEEFKTVKDQYGPLRDIY